MIIDFDIGLIARHAHRLIVACMASHYPGATTNNDRVSLLNLARLYLYSRPVPHVFGILRQRIVIGVEIS